MDSSAHAGNCQPTRWSLVLRAGDARDPAARAALDELCREYWQPLRSFARRRGLGPEDAEDATQSFFALILEKETLAHADPQRGKLRTYLLTAFTRHLINLAAHRSAEKRGGGCAPISLEAAAEEGRADLEPSDEHTPERLFHRQWALTVLAKTLAALEAQWTADGRAGEFVALRPFLDFSGEESGPSYHAVAAQLGGTVGAARVAVHRLRKRYREALFAEIGGTLDDPSPEAIKEEIQALFAALG